MRDRHSRFMQLICCLGLLGGSLVANAEPAPDPTALGPYSVSTGTYKYPALVMSDVLSDRLTELWAEAYYPDPTGGPATMPIIVILHGNHATCGTGSSPRFDTDCSYTMSGTCPPGYVVVPNHEGYRYFATRLASWGYFVVSINANRGITCGGGIPGDSGLNLARGRLVLKHLELLSLFSTGQMTPPPSLGMDPFGMLDFSQVGLAGHSRGGEGVRAAYAQYNDAGSPWPGVIQEPVEFVGIFEIGAVDGQTSRVLDAKGVPWNQVLPICDGDVSDLQGIKPYDRMMNDLDEDPVSPKSTYAVWGANHNFFNTEWQTSDSSGCRGHDPLFPQTIGSPEQQTVGRVAAMGFFRTHLAAGGLDVDLIRNFDPLSEIPTVVSDITNVDRNFSLSPNGDTSPQLEDFSGPTGRNMYGFRNPAKKITGAHQSIPGHDSSLRGGRAAWTQASSTTGFQINWSAAGDGLDSTGYDTLELQVSRSTSGLNPPAQTPTDFSLQLIGGDKSQSVKLRLSDYTDLLGPVGSTDRLHQLVKTVRIPLDDFTGVNRGSLRSLRIIFDQTGSGELYFAGIRLSLFTESAVSAIAPAAEAKPMSIETLGDSVSYVEDAAMGEVPDSAHQLSGRVVAVRHVASVSGDGNAEIELMLDNGQQFPVRGALAVLEIGNARFTVSRYPDDGSTDRLIFTISANELESLSSGAPIRVFYGNVDSELEGWEASFGTL